ncbi:hypothetical protein ABB37_04353 [Leptomonas pyrrhocoris]|uniref:Ataxin-10 domain-containing protein n=1 Tax=Leptomonas pyrrhocoris TaxID=157538 RepID=A0A0M9G2E0_LEPPY|nr:hypothetical protein ABB37_04353 [Leptomonas pyrrhocoris]KPA80965.1 hypothetical protein ABB37_04353 [Leptomonas pyrrhocoris]|eukprot:XP_015659404.1 hypothetical protein ABB37_04353 [Leptomonas pyrrhocoris]
MSEKGDLLLQCEAALSNALLHFSEDADCLAPLPPQERLLATLKACTEALSNLTPVPRVSDIIAGYCADLLECCGTNDGVLLCVVTQFLADMSLQEDNVDLFLRFGLPSEYLLILQRWQSLTTNTLNCVFDFVSTICTSSAASRQSLRPCIPYVLAAMHHNLYAIEVLFGAAVTLSTLTTLDNDNCKLVAQRGGVQILISAFYHAYRTQSTVVQVEQKKSLQSSCALIARAQTHRLGEKEQLCQDVQKWCRDVLLKVCRSRCEDTTAALQQADFGAYGHCLALDELKWTLMLDVSGIEKRPVKS